jgi:hypothetical protein
MRGTTPRHADASACMLRRQLQQQGMLRRQLQRQSMLRRQLQQQGMLRRQLQQQSMLCFTPRRCCFSLVL